MTEFDEQEQYERLCRAFVDGVRKGMSRADGMAELRSKARVADSMYRLLDELNMSDDCTTCPRYIDDERLTPSQRCRGHLTWVCNKIRNEIKAVGGLNEDS